jgi:hypothetical protein
MLAAHESDGGAASGCMMNDAKSVLESFERPMLAVVVSLSKIGSGAELTADLGNLTTSQSGREAIRKVSYRSEKYVRESTTHTLPSNRLSPARHTLFFVMRVSCSVAEFSSIPLPGFECCCVN